MHQAMVHHEGVKVNTHVSVHKSMPLSLLTFSLVGLHLIDNLLIVFEICFFGFFDLDREKEKEMLETIFDCQL